MFFLNRKTTLARIIGSVVLGVVVLPLLALATDKPISIQNLPICMDFGCKHQQKIALSQEDWDSVANWFAAPAIDPQIERQQIKQAIGWMEVVVGRHTPTYRDVGGDLLNDEKEAVFPGQLDCIDESMNTTTYLKLFEQHGLLKHHKVIERAYRRAVFDQHWAGQIETLHDGERWVVDSWFQHNGYLPYLQLSQEWEKIPLFTSYLDSSQDTGEKESLFRRLFNE